MADYSRNHFIASSPSDTFPLEDEAPARVHRARTRRACGTERSHGHARRAAAATPAHEGSRRANARHATQPSDRRARTSGRRTGLDRFAKGVVVAAVLALGIATVPAVAQGTTLPDLLTNTVAMLTSTQEEVIESHKVTEGVEDPDGTTITLFDYWDDDSHKDGDDYLGAAYSSTVRYEGGINYDDSTGTRNQLEFNQGGHGNIDLSINSSGTALRQKLVQGVLGDDGYPVLGGLGTLGSSYRDGNGSAITQKSLAYLFNSNDEDTETQVKGKEVYENAKGLLQVDDEGYYYYNSRENFASYNEETGSFDLYDAPAVYPYGNSGLGQFFPFDDATEVFDGTVSNGTLNAANVNSVASTATGSTAKLNHWFGLNMTTQFTQTNNGIASTGDDVTFEFSGDDDVWVFIDGVLVGDMGGIHSARSLTINFKTGEVNADGTTTTIRECFANAAETYSAQGYTYDESDFSGDTFANNTVHTLQFYYLERGNWDSNMSLKFNLTNSPLNGAEKVDENGNGIGGVTFGLYPADENHQPIDNDNPAMTVETSDDGTVSFVNEDGTPMTFAELYTKYKTEHYVVRELDTPDGYRTIDGDIRVRYDHDTGAIYCENSWETGVFGATGEIVTAPTTMQLTNDATGETYNATLSTGGDAGLTLTSSDGTSSSGGILFATVLHQSNDGTWHAVYGTREEGDWSTTESSTEEYAAVLDAITEVLDHNERGAWLFNKTEDNQYEAEIKELPGDVSGYRSVNENGKFMLQMYYSTASSLSEVNASNLYKVKSLDEGKGSNGATFTRQFAAIFKVPNIHNHLVVQKLDEDGNAISATSTSDVMSAEFSLYRKDDVTLNDDGTYEIHEGATAYMTAKTYDRDADDALAANAQGVASFDGIAAGDYVLIETKAPQGYAAGEYASHVYVDNSGVYVNAGSATDGIAVHRDIGQLVSTMKQFATDTNLDNTLTYVTAQLQTSNDDACLTDGTLWQDVEGASQVLKFNNASSNNALDYSVVEGKFPLTAESGWTRMVVRQFSGPLDDGTVVTPDQVLLDENNNPLELKQLFTIVPFVTFSDQAIGDLQISKTVEGYTGIAEEDEQEIQAKEFKFSVAVTDAEGNSLGGSYNIVNANDEVIGTLENGVISATDTVDGETKTVDYIKLTHGQTATVQGLPVGAKFTVTEALTGSTDGWSCKRIAGNDGSDVVGNTSTRTATGTIKDTDNNVRTPITVEANFTNKFSVRATGITININKVCEHWSTTGVEADFSFLLEPYADDNGTNPSSDPVGRGMTTDVTMKGVDSKPTVLKIDPDVMAGYTEPGTYRYTLREKVNPHEAGVSYSPALYYIVVTVKQDATTADLYASYKMYQVIDEDGQANPSEVTGAATFTNSYDAEAANYNIRGTKKLLNDGVEQDPADNKYTFQLTRYDGSSDAPMPDADGDGRQDESVTTQAVDGYFVFPAINFTDTGETDLHEVYQYKVSEVNGGAAGITYDAGYFIVTLTLTRENSVLKVTPSYQYVDSDGNVSDWTKKEGGKLKIPEFTNTYKPVNSAKVSTIGGTKTLVGRNSAAGESFEFALVGADQTTKDAIAKGFVTGTTATVSNLTDGQGKGFTFEDLTFSKKDTYTFNMVEVLPSGVSADSPEKDGLTYDTGSHTVVVEVVDEFTGDQLTGNLLVRSITIDGKAVTGDAVDQSAAFTNTYTETGSYTLKATKYLTGRDFEKGDSFTFQITADTEGAPMPSGVNDEGKITIAPTSGAAAANDATDDEDAQYQYAFEFGTFQLGMGDVGKTYTYTLKETGENLPAGVTQDTTEYTLKLTPQSNGKGGMTFDVVLTNSKDETVDAANLSWTNKYEPTAATVELQGAKRLEGRGTLTDETFTALLSYNATDDPATAQGVSDGTVELPANMTFVGGHLAAGQTTTATFDKITISKKGVYTFKIAEVMPTDEDGDATNGYQKNGVTFDEGYWTVKVTVSDGRDVNGTLQGYLNSTVEYTHYLKDGSVDPDSAKLINGLFVNKYTESGSYTLKGVKNITGRSFEAGDSFTFGITSADADAPMPSNVAGGTLTVTPTAGTSSCDVDFGTFTFDSSHVGKTYTYTLSEVTPEQNKLAGMTYDTTAYTLKLAITSDGLGTITATPTLTKVVNAESADVPEVAADVTPTWTNTFAATPVDVSIPVVKNIAWSSEESGTFEFKLIPGPTNPAGDPVTDAVNGLTATIKIDGTDGTNDEGAYTDKTAFSLTYTTEGTYQYRVRELVGDHLAGVSYSSALYEVTVTVTRNADATLSKAVKIVRLQDRYGNQMNVEVDAASFTNTYSDEAAEYSIRGLKWVDNEGTLEPAASNRYTMVLVPQGNAPAPTSASNATTFEAGVVDGYFAFGGIKFTHSDIGKTYSYIVYEKSAGSLVDGMLFDTRAYKIDLTISKNDKNVITVTPTYTLYASGYDTESGTLKGDGATWDKNNGTKVGIPEFFNKYTPQGASFEFTGDKTLVGRDALDGETFGFTLAPDTSDTFTASALAAGLVKTSDGADLAADGTLTATVKDAKNNQKSAFSFGSLSFLKAGTYTFKISEDQPDEAKAGLAYDTGTWTVSVTVSDVRTDGKLAGRLEVTNFTYALDDSATTSTTGASFTNTYTVAPTSAVMTAKKTLEGRTLEAGEFTFSLTLASSNTVVSTATNAADGTVTFDERTYTTAGERIYYITEENGGKNTIGYDKTTYKVKVNVVDDGAGKLSAQVTYYDAQGAETSEPPTFKNTFTPLATDTVSIDGEKLLTGRDAFGGETFGFTLTAADDGTKALLDDGAVTKKDGTALGADEELKADVSGAKDGVGVPFSFDVLTFSKAGTYAFTMKETVPGNKAAGLEYDTSTWTVTVTVAGEDDNGKKLEKLQATVAYAKNGVVVSDATKASFSNVYAANGSVELSVFKTLSGRDLEAGEFGFVLVNADDDAQVWTATNDADGSVAFGSISYTEAGTYTYTIAEAGGDDSAITYDDGTFTAVVTVTDDLAGKLDASVVYYANNSDGTQGDALGKDEVPTFENAYTPPTPDPEPDPEPEPDPDPSPDPEPEPDPNPSPDPEPDPDPNPDPGTDPEPDPENPEPENPDPETETPEPGTDPDGSGESETPGGDVEAPADGEAPATTELVSSPAADAEQPMPKTNDSAAVLALVLGVLAAASAAAAAICLQVKKRLKR